MGGEGQAFGGAMTDPYLWDRYVAARKALQEAFAAHQALQDRLVRRKRISRAKTLLAQRMETYKPD